MIPRLLARHVPLEQIDLLAVERDLAPGDEHLLNPRLDLERIAANDHQVRDLARLDRSDLRVHAEDLRGIDASARGWPRRGRGPRRRPCRPGRESAARLRRIRWRTRTARRPSRTPLAPDTCRRGTGPRSAAVSARWSESPARCGP